MSPRLRLAWFATIVFVAIFGMGELARWIGESLRGPSWWAQDFVTYDAAWRIIRGGALYADPKFLYPPLGSLVGLPFLVMDRFAASLVLAGLKVALAAACVLWLTPTWKASSRALAFVGLVTCLPFLHDLMLGNTNVLVVAAMVPAVFGRSRSRNGILLGLAGAAFAKPLMIPVVIWMAIWRRESFIGSIASGVVASLVGVAVFGIGAHADWITAVRGGSSWLSTPFAGNHGVTALVPALWPPVAAVTAGLLVLVLVRRGPRVGLIWSVTTGILLVPYAGTYSALPIVLALPAIGPGRPWLVLAIIAASPIASTIPLPFYAAAILVAALTLREPRGPFIGLGPLRVAEAPATDACAASGATGNVPAGGA